MGTELIIVLSSPNHCNKVFCFVQPGPKTPLITTQHETEQTTIETSLPDVSAKWCLLFYAFGTYIW
jgi:hypothetical protein